MYTSIYLFVEKLSKFLNINYFFMFDNMMKNELKKSFQYLGIT
jgi:hypothetical protein